MLPRVYVYTDELSQVDYEPCTNFAQVNPAFANLTVGGAPMNAKLTLIQDGATAGGRPRYRIMIDPA